MADETIQDDQPQLKPAMVPKPEREPMTIEGAAVDITPNSEEPEEAASPAEPVVEAEPLVSVEPADPEAIFVPTEPAPFHADDDWAAPPPPPPPSEPAPPVAPAAPAPPSRTPAFVAGGVGVLVGAIIVVGAGYVFQPSATNLQSVNDRLAALDSALSGETSARKALEGRLTAIESRAPDATASTLEARLAKLENAPLAADALAAVAAEARAAAATADKTAATVASLGTAIGSPSSAPNPEVVKLISDQQALADRLAKLEQAPVGAQPAADPALADRIGKLEGALAAEKAAPPPAPDPEIGKLAGDEKSLSDRIAKLEAALAAPKTEGRADPNVVAKGDPVAQTVAAIALERRLLAGQPYPLELIALDKLGAEPKALAALRPYAQSGAPSVAALAAAFNKLAPALAAPQKAAAHGDYGETIWDEVKGLVKVRSVGEVKGDDPAAVTSQISAALSRADLTSARADFGKLPEGERTAAAAWAKDLDGVSEARAAALSLIETSLARFSDQKN